MSTTQHPLTETDAAGLWDGYLSDDHGVWHRQDHIKKARAVDALRAAFDAGREHERTTPADPHHDPRPWQDCTPADIRQGDLVERPFRSTVRVGVARAKDAGGDWWTEDGLPLTLGDRWTLRRIPAPAPSAEEVELPGEDGEILLDVEALDPAPDDVHRSNKTVYLDGRWFGIDSHTGEEIRIWPIWIAAATLPDGTRVRRDGEHENGEPRFVKVQEEEK